MPVPPSTRIYLDHNATSPLDSRAAAAMADAARGLGNPSSIHAEGRAARDALEAARREVAGLIGGEPADLVFTSGGSEADALGMIGLYRAGRAVGRPARVAVGATSHPALLGAARSLAGEGAEVVVLPVDREGRTDEASLERALDAGVSAVGFGLVNHELGTIEDAARLVPLCRRAGARVHLDAVQAAGRIHLAVDTLAADSLALSAHKLGGPSGVGALWISPGVDLAPLIPGGHQERGRRPGSENLFGAIGFAAVVGAARAAAAAAMSLADLRDTFERGVRASGGRVHGDGAPRVCATSNVGWEGAPGDAVVAALDLAGVAASTGAACTSGTVAPSPVLLACGLAPERAREAVRFSLGSATTAAEIAAVLELLPEIIRRVRAFS